MSTTSAATRRPAEQEPTSALDRFFEITRRGTTAEPRCAGTS